MKPWSPAESMPREPMRTLQLQRLQETVSRAYERVPFYRRKLDESGLKPSDIQSLADLSRIPMTVKTDLRDQYPFGLMAVPQRDIVRYHASSGTTGKPIVVGYTRHDMQVWTECCARMATAAGVTDADVAQICFGYGMFTGGFGLHYGLEKIGATVIPMSSGNTEKQIMIMQDYGSTALISTPSYALYMSEVLHEQGVKKSDIKLKFGLFGAEGSTEEMRTQLENRWGIIATENYGM
ncbi:MAG: phenylacetate--CoA ligase family protein, partial [Clostridia bacterium]|nr:phenylacetate--CoA ligase family protein [Clostridia bacterium]